MLHITHTAQSRNIQRWRGKFGNTCTLTTKAEFICFRCSSDNKKIESKRWNILKKQKSSIFLFLNKDIHPMRQSMEKRYAGISIDFIFSRKLKLVSKIFLPKFKSFIQFLPLPTHLHLKVAKCPLLTEKFFVLFYRVMRTEGDKAIIFAHSNQYFLSIALVQVIPSSIILWFKTLSPTSTYKQAGTMYTAFQQQSTTNLHLWPSNSDCTYGVSSYRWYHIFELLQFTLSQSGVFCDFQFDLLANVFQFRLACFRQSAQVRFLTKQTQTLNMHTLGTRWKKYYTSGKVDWSYSLQIVRHDLPAITLFVTVPQITELAHVINDEKRKLQTIFNRSLPSPRGEFGGLSPTKQSYI